MSQAADAVAYAQAQIGKPYVFATSGPDTFDCSGLTAAAYAHANPPVHLIHWTGGQIDEGVEVAKSELEPGDLVFPDSGHVVLYIGNNQIIEAPHAGATVRMGPMYGFWRARRVATDGQSSSAEATLTAAVNPLDPLDIFSALTAGATFTKLVGMVFKNRNRIGMFFLSGLVLIVGLVFIFRRQEAALAKGAMQIAGSVGSEVATGYGVAKIASIASRPRMSPAEGGEVSGHGTGTGSAPYAGRHEFVGTPGQVASRRKFRMENRLMTDE